MKSKVIIVDDESLAREMLKEMLNIVSPEVEVVSTCEDIPEAVKAINKHSPDIVFLDIDMPRYKGVDIVEFFDEMNFEIIFTTAHQQYAIDALKLRAFDYLLKPIDLADLKESLNRFFELKSKRIEIEAPKNKLLVNTTQFVHFIDLNNILYLKAEGAYTKIVCIDTSIIASKNLKFYEDYLSKNLNFIRCHKSFIVNREKITSINKSRQEVNINNGDIIYTVLDKIDNLISF